MFSKSLTYITTLCIFILCISTTLVAKDVYGIKVAASTIDSIASSQFYTLLSENSISNPKVSNIQFAEQLRKVDNKNFDFWSFLIILVILAILRFLNPSYFRNIFIAFRNSNLSARHLREQLSQNSLASLVMDIFFNASFGMYLFQLLKYYKIPTIHIINSDFILLALLIVGSALIYIIKTSQLKLTGYLYSITELTDTYTFNIHLINKILSVILLPISAIIAFGVGIWVQIAIVISFICIIFSFANRYIRSASLFRYFVQTNKFHFFLYLCASEILPIFILVKLFNNIF